MFPGELVVKAGNICPTINESVGIDDFHSVCGFQHLEKDSHRLGCCTYYYTSTKRRGRLRRRIFPFQKSVEKVTRLTTSSSSSSTSLREGICSSVSFSCLTLLIFLGVKREEKVGHAPLRCLGFRQRKQSPSLIHRFLFSGIS